MHSLLIFPFLDHLFMSETLGLLTWKQCHGEINPIYKKAKIEDMRIVANYGTS